MTDSGGGGYDCDWLNAGVWFGAAAGVGGAGGMGKWECRGFGYGSDDADEERTCPNDVTGDISRCCCCGGAMGTGFEKLWIGDGFCCCFCDCCWGSLLMLLLPKETVRGAILG